MRKCLLVIFSDFLMEDFFFDPLLDTTVLTDVAGLLTNSQEKINHKTHFNVGFFAFKSHLLV